MVAKIRPKFGVILLPYSTSPKQIIEAAKHAEALGFDSVWVSDHLQRGSIPTLECWTTLSAIATSTQSIRLGSLATCNSFRNPVLLAKTIATVSQIARGRLDLAIGVGYDSAEHLSSGYPFPNSARRTEQLGETVEILKLLFSKESVNYSGKYWKLVEAVCEPKPLSDGAIWIAGRSEKLINMASSLAIKGMNILPYAGVLDKRKLSSFEELTALTNRIKTSGLAVSMYCGDGGTIIGRDASDYQFRLEKVATELGLPLQVLAERQANLSVVRGSVDECRRSLDNLNKLGAEELMMIFPGWQLGDYASMDLFAEEFLGGS